MLLLLELLCHKFHNLVEHCSSLIFFLLFLILSVFDPGVTEVKRYYGTEIKFILCQELSFNSGAWNTINWPTIQAVQLVNPCTLHNALLDQRWRPEKLKTAAMNVAIFYNKPNLTVHKRSVRFSGILPTKWTIWTKI